MKLDLQFMQLMKNLENTKEVTQMKLKHTTFFGKTYELKLYKGHYLPRYGGGIAIQATINEDGFEEPWSTITVNLGELPEENMAAIDVNNNGANILDELINAGFCTLLYFKRSGYCEYPVVEFTEEFLNGLEEMR